MSERRYPGSRSGETSVLEKIREPNSNQESLTGEAASYPIGTGVSAATGGTIGAVIGGAVGGPVGSMIGAAVGGLTGGFAGKGLAELVNPTEEDTFWSDAYKDRPYAQSRSYDELRLAYRYGWESRCRYADRNWNEVEHDLQNEWAQRHGTSSNLDWNTAKPAAYDAWNRVESRHRYNTEEEPYWRETYRSRPYGQNRNFDDLSPAYRYGWESGRTYGREGRFEDYENALKRGWEAKWQNKLAWHEAKDAVRDSWDRATNRWSDDEDRYWRESCSSRPYAAGRNYNDLRPAFRYGHESALYYQGRRWEDVENDLSSNWERHSTGSKWHDVKDAAHDAWDRVTNRSSGALNRDMTDMVGGATEGTYNVYEATGYAGISGERTGVSFKGAGGVTEHTFSIRLQELHDPDTGRLDAARIADYLRIPLKQLSDALGRNYSTVHRTPSALALQDSLRSIKRSLEILGQVFVDRSAVLAWLNSPHPDLGRQTPLNVILQGHPDAVEDMLEAALEGTPS